MTPAPVPYADLSDPQTLNLYSYVRNNPLSHADADGHQCDTCQKVWNWEGDVLVCHSTQVIGIKRVIQNCTPRGSKTTP
jgi:hypothetical protein